MLQSPASFGLISCGFRWNTKRSSDNSTRISATKPNHHHIDESLITTIIRMQAGEVTSYEIVEICWLSWDDALDAAWQQQTQKWLPHQINHQFMWDGKPPGPMTAPATHIKIST